MVILLAGNKNERHLTKLDQQHFRKGHKEQTELGKNWIRSQRREVVVMFIGKDEGFWLGEGRNVFTEEVPVKKRGDQ